MNDDTPTTRIDPVPEEPGGPGSAGGSGSAGGPQGAGGPDRKAWSDYPDRPTGPAGPTHRAVARSGPRPDAVEDSGSHAPVPPIAPPPDRRDSDRDDAGRSGWLPLVVGVVAVAVLLAGGVLGWMLLGGEGDEQSTPPPSRTSTAATLPPPAPATPSTNSSTTGSTTATTALPPEARCGRDYLLRQFGAAVTVRECDGEHAVLEVPTAEHPVALYHWERERWTFVAEPYGGVCRDQLDAVGVPERFRRDFPPCGVPRTSSTSSSSASTAPTTTPPSGSTPAGTTPPTAPSSSAVPSTPGTSAPAMPTSTPSVPADEPVPASGSPAATPR